MLKKFLFSLGLFFTLFIATSANAGWKANSDFSAVYDYKIKGKVAARYLGIPQYPQPTNYTCGATTMSMLMLWETHKKGRVIRFSPLLVPVQICLSESEIIKLTVLLLIELFVLRPNCWVL